MGLTKQLQTSNNKGMATADHLLIGQTVIASATDNNTGECLKYKLKFLGVTFETSRWGHPLPDLDTFEFEVVEPFFSRSSGAYEVGEVYRLIRYYARNFHFEVTDYASLLTKPILTRDNITMKYKIKTKRLSDGTIQIGYNIGEHWCGVCNLIRFREGYKTDNYPGWNRTITEWKIQIEEIMNNP